MLRRPGGASAGLRCGPLTVPNHKLVPDSRWILDLPARTACSPAPTRDDVKRDRSAASRSTSIEPRSRSSSSSSRSRAAGRRSDDRASRCRPPGFTRVATSGYYARAMPAAERARWGVARRRARRRCVAGAFAACGCWGFQQRAAVRLQRRRERALRAARDRACSGTAEPALLRQPAGLHVPAARRCSRLVRRARRGVVGDAFATDPTEAFALARVVAALLGAVAVGLLTSPARGCSTAASACSRRALLAVAFLPVYYSHLALNDVPTLAPLCLALVGAARRPPRAAGMRDYVLAGRRRSGWRARPSTRPGSCCCRCSPRRAASRRRPPRGSRGPRCSPARCALAALPGRQPVRAARPRRVPRRPAPAVRGRRRRAAASSA